MTQNLDDWSSDINIFLSCTSDWINQQKDFSNFLKTKKSILAVLKSFMFPGLDFSSSPKAAPA